MECHYKILGLEAGASQDDIKRAYRRLALKYHPDKCGDTEMFLKISHAYQILSTNPGQEQDHIRFEMLNKVLKMFLNVAARTTTFSKEKKDNTVPTRVPIKVTLDDLYNHKIKKVSIKRANNFRKNIDFSKIDPSGWDTKTFYVSLLNYKPCYVFIGEGDVGVCGDRVDLVLDLNIQEHPDIKIDTVCQYDLYVERKISLYEYYYGTKTNIDHVSGEVLSCEKSFDDGTMFYKFSGVGLPKYDECSGKTCRGDLFVFYRLSLLPHKDLLDSSEPLQCTAKEFMRSAFGMQPLLHEDRKEAA